METTVVINEDRSLRFENISKSVICADKHIKQILTNISGHVIPGEVVALMGPSGSGKTTLLQVLGGRSLAGVSGQVLLGGALYQRKTMRHKVAYILQDDIFMSSYILTVRDHLMFAASMKLPEALTKAEKAARVVKVIEDLGLMYCADSPLCLVSGGERKRTSIGLEIIADPMLLLVDEGTSGLDSASAASLMKTIRTLATNLLIPVVQAIHQPSTAVFYSFDKLLLLSFGHIVYIGPPKGCMSYFLSLGYAPSEGVNVNPADFALELLHHEYALDHVLVDGRHPRDVLVEGWAESQMAVCEVGALDSETKYNTSDSIPLPTDSIPLKRDFVPGEDVKDRSLTKRKFSIDILPASILTSNYPSNYSTQFRGLLVRAFRTAKSSRFGWLNVSETIILALLVGACWYQTPADETHLSDLNGYLFLSMLYWFFIALFQGLLEFLPERACIKKEREAGMYHLSAYFFAKTIASAPVRVFLPMLYFFISYPMAVQDPKAAALFALCAILVLVSLVGESVGFLVGTLTVAEDVAISSATIVAVGMILMGGFYIKIDHIPLFLRWLRYTSTFLYGYQCSIQIQVMLGAPILCQGGYVIYQCGFPGQYFEPLSAAKTLEYLGVTELSLGAKIGILIAMLVGIRLAAYIALRFAPHNLGRV